MRLSSFSRLAPAALLLLGLLSAARSQDERPVLQAGAADAAATQPALTTQPAEGAETQPASQPASQPATRPSTQPASAPAPPVNPLRSPASAFEFFEQAAQEERWLDAIRAMNFSRIDPEIVNEQGPEYARKLAVLVARLREEGYFDPATLATQPDADPQPIGRDPLLLILERYEYEETAPPAAAATTPAEGAAPPEAAPQKRVVRRWQFAAVTVADTPNMFENLDGLIDQIQEKEAIATAPAAPEPPDEVDPLRSPYHTVQHFYISFSKVKSEIAAYEEAMECMDFTDVPAETFEEKTEYVDGLYAILVHLNKVGELELEKLPKEVEGDIYLIGSDPFQVVLTRGADGRWRFRSRTVRGVPEMLGKLQKLQTTAQAAPGQPPPAPVEVTPPELVRDTISPQGTMNLFLSAMEAQDLPMAVRTFDLEDLSDSERGLADLLAGKLWMILNRHKVIVLQDIDNNPNRPAPSAILKHPAGQILIARKRSGPRDGEWLFTGASLRDIDQLYEAFELKPVLPQLRDRRISFMALPSLYVREYLVPPAWKRPLWGLHVWQWVGIFGLLVIGGAVRWTGRSVLPRIARWLTATETTMMLPQAVRRAMAPSATLLMLVVWSIGLEFLDLGALLMASIWFFLKLALTISAIFAFYRLIDVFTGYAAARGARLNMRVDQVLVPLLQKTLKVIVIAVGAILFVKILGFEVTPLVAGLGVGGLAFGLAAQDTLKNFFGSVNVVFDRPFQVGDWVRLGDVEGTVESVGLRSSRIRTFYNSQVTIPNSEIMTSRIDNLGRRRYRRISCMISVTYATRPEQLEAFCEGIRELIRRHPYTRKDYYHCWVNEFAASSVNILLYCFHETPEWGTELRERHRLFLDIIRLAQKLGVDFAFPTQTVHLHHESTPPDSRPPKPGLPGTPEQAMRLGAEEAAALVHQAFGGEVKKPPPVEY